MFMKFKGALCSFNEVFHANKQTNLIFKPDILSCICKTTAQAYKVIPWFDEAIHFTCAVNQSDI